MPTTDLTPQAGAASAAYTSKPVTIRAIRNLEDGSNAAAVSRFAGSKAIPHSKDLKTGALTLGIRTLEGDMLCRPGDWLVRGTENELYPVKDSVFRRKYAQEAQ